MPLFASKAFHASSIPIPWIHVQATFSRFTGWQDAGTFYRPTGVNLSIESVERAEACKVYRMLRLTMHPGMRVRESRYNAITRSWGAYYEYPMSLGELVNQCPVSPHVAQVGGWIKQPSYHPSYRWRDWAYVPGTGW